MTPQLTPIKSVLIVLARVVRNLDATSPLIRILEEVHIGALIEPMMAGSHLRWTVEVVNISEAGTFVSTGFRSIELGANSQRCYILLSWPRGHLVKAL